MKRIKGIELEPVYDQATRKALVRIVVVDETGARDEWVTTPTHALNVSSQLAIVAVASTRQGELLDSDPGAEIIVAPKLSDL